MTLTHRRWAGVIGAATAATVLLAACAGTEGDAQAAGADQGGADTGTVTITDNHGTHEVPVNPERVVALDNLTAQTLADWDVDLVAAPQQLFRLWPEYAENPDVLDVGTHREPDLEQIVAADADLIIAGGRFGAHYEELRELNPNIIDLTVRDGEDHAEELKRQTEVLGQIFDRTEEAEDLIAQFDQAVADARAAYNGEDTVVGLLTSGGQILYAAPGDGRSVGALFPTLDLVPGVDVEAQDTSHGDDISVELIADANPDWLVVLDRDALFDEDDYVSARELIADSEALQHVTAVQQDQIIYLSGDFYLTEGIQAYTELYNDVAEAFRTAE